MRRWFGCFAGFVLCWSAPTLAAPLQAYGHLPAIEDVQISPDGATLAFIVTEGEQRRILVKRLADQALLGGLNVGKAKLRDLRWADGQHLLITTSNTSRAGGSTDFRHEWLRVTAFDVAQKSVHPLLDDVVDAMNVTYGAPEVRMIDGRAVVFLLGTHFLNTRGVVALFATDLATYKSGIVQAGSSRSQDWVVDATGRTVAEAEYDQPSGVWTLWVHTPAGPWKATGDADTPLGGLDLAGLAPDGHSVLVRGSEDGKPVIQEVSTVDGAWGPPKPDPYDELIFSPATHTLIGGRALRGDQLSFEFFDPKQQKEWDASVRAFPGEQVSLVSESADQRKLVVLVDGPKDGPAYAVVDLDTKHATWIGAPYPDLTPEDIAEVKPIAFKAADGLALTGYLTFPRGKPVQNLPLVVLPHGGPADRDNPGFDWWSQAIASRGYAVLRVNFRGSSGFGDALLKAGYGQWGRKMQTDLSDGVRYLAAQGTIDPKRVCIFGGSYGGYAALAGATLDTGVYRCAISLAGPSDLRRMLRFELGDVISKDNATMRFWTQFMGARGADDVALDAISPASLAAKAAVPILLIHGLDDTVVPFEQSRVMAEAMQHVGRPVTLVTLKGEDHWLSSGDTRLQMLTAAMSFLEANNPPN